VEFVGVGKRAQSPRDHRLTLSWLTSCCRHPMILMTRTLPLPYLFLDEAAFLEPPVQTRHFATVSRFNPVRPNNEHGRAPGKPPFS